MTSRALRKLCFGATGTKDTDFLMNIKNELSEYKKVEGIFSFQNRYKEIDERRLVEFYQKVLKSDYARKELEISIFDNLEDILNTEFQTLNKFQSALEKSCYIKKSHITDDEVKTKLLEMNGSLLFQITSYDLLLCDKSIKNRRHTELWNEFWSEKNQNCYPIRLNPEISVLWREKQDNKIQKDRYDQVIRNRFLAPQWNLKVTLTLNATEERIDLSFKKSEDIKKEIRKFNKKFDEYIQNKNIFYYGLDRGLKELATLCVIREDPGSKEEFFVHPISIYKLKEKYYSHQGDIKHTASKNPSYFIKKPAFFEKSKKPTLNLTTAKLIDGKIVENGDIFTYLKFKELSAKRRLFKYKSNIKEQKVFISEDKKSIAIKTMEQGEDKSVPVYYFREEFKKILSIEGIKNNLQSYLDRLYNNQKEELSLTEDKINHLRKAIASNIVGILSFLHRQTPGLIILEKNQKGRSNEENIAGQLEWALYKRFQTEGLVPPCLKEVDILLEHSKGDQTGHRHKTNTQDTINNFGLIHFIKPDDTSQICPKCNKKSNSDGFKKRKKEGWFKCEKCDFNTKRPPEEVSFLNDPDKIAAYNICKKGREFQSNKRNFKLK